MEPFPFPLSFLFMQNYGIEAKLCSGNIIICEEEEGLQENFYKNLFLKKVNVLIPFFPY